MKVLGKTATVDLPFSKTAKGISTPSPNLHAGYLHETSMYVGKSLFLFVLEELCFFFQNFIVRNEGLHTTHHHILMNKLSSSLLKFEDCITQQLCKKKTKQSSISGVMCIVPMQ